MDSINNEELPEIKQAAELDENAEYINSRNKNEEDPLLTAQRYLNIYHQIHIFKEAKKKEFNNSLLTMPDNIKDILPHLPGGRILLEHIAELEEKSGIKDSYTQQLLEVTPDTHSSLYSSAKTENSAGNLSLSKDFAKELAESLAEALKENNAEKPLHELGVLLKQLIQQTRNTSIKSDEQPKTAITKKIVKSSPMEPVQITENNVNAVNNYNSSEDEDIDINVFLQHTHNQSPATQTAEKPKVAINPRTRAPLQFKNQLTEADIKAAESMSMTKISAVKEPQKQTLKSSKPEYSEALKKIKNAIDSTSTVSLNSIDVKPVSLNPQDSQTSSDDEDWIYVDEDGNPITDISGNDEWEYVDENGNPIKL